MACHSGALDKEALLNNNNSKIIEKDTADDTIIKQYSSKGNQVLATKKSKSLTSIFNVMQTQFADLKSSHGTVVISAAGGLEYAFESSEWNNGVFTYCIRKGIEEKKADLETGNYDGNVTVQELTKGKQKPTSRKENLEYDWTIK